MFVNIVLLTGRLYRRTISVSLVRDNVVPGKGRYLEILVHEGQEPPKAWALSAGWAIEAGNIRKMNPGSAQSQTTWTVVSLLSKAQKAELKDNVKSYLKAHPNGPEVRESVPSTEGSDFEIE